MHSNINQLPFMRSGNSLTHNNSTKELGDLFKNEPRHCTEATEIGIRYITLMITSCKILSHFQVSIFTSKLKLIIVV